MIDSSTQIYHELVGLSKYFRHDVTNILRIAKWYTLELKAIFNHPILRKIVRSDLSQLLDETETVIRDIKQIAKSIESDVQTGRFSEESYLQYDPYIIKLQQLNDDLSKETDKVLIFRDRLQSSTSTVTESVSEETLLDWEHTCKEASPEKYWKENYAANNAGIPLGRFYLPQNNFNESVLIMAEDSYFIVEARKNWPKAIEEIRRLNNVIEQLRTQIDTYYPEGVHADQVKEIVESK